MKVTVVGFWGGYPASNGASSAYLVEDEDYVLVLDFGSGVLSKLQTFKQVRDLDAVILSHYHADHIADIGVLQHAVLVNNYITDDKKILPIYGHTEDEDVFQTLTDDFTKGVAYDPNEALQLGPFTIHFFKTNHSVPCYGMRITNGKHTFVYTADSAYQEEWIDFCKDAHMLLTDCNLYADQTDLDVGHMTSKQAAYIAKQANVKELVLTHLPHYGDHQQLVSEAKEEFSGTIHLAYEGFVWQPQNRILK